MTSEQSEVGQTSQYKRVCRYESRKRSQPPGCRTFGSIAIWPLVNAEKLTNEMVRRNLRVSKRSPLEEVAEAYQYMELNEQVGKIALTLGK